jgi:hypothetical protein
MKNGDSRMVVLCLNGHENVDGAFFCDHCGAVLEDAAVPGARICAVCGQPNAPEAAECANCGAALADSAAISRATVRLVIPATGASFDLSDLQEAVIGRADPTCDVFPDIDLAPHGGEKDGVSRQHARFRRERDRFTIEDMQSINFTFLNKQRLEANAPTPLKSGDELRLGRIVLRFEAV